VRIADDSVDEVKPAAGRAELEVEDIDIEDYHDLVNALKDGPSDPARASFEVRWFRKIQTRHIVNPAMDQQFEGTFTQTHAQVEWSARKKGFAFQSDPASTSQVVYAEVGEERNGVFF
jgi:hypothetical protein